MKDSDTQQPLVSVAVTAYNAERTLARALDSILQQRVDFAYEIVVGNDASKDGTHDLVEQYRERYPAIVQPLHQAKNVGTQRNYFATFEKCRGKYIAWLDADDFWTDPQKLEIQTQVLEQDATIAVVAHTVRWVTPDGTVKRERFPEMAAGRYGLDQIVRKNFLPSPSVMFRNGTHKLLPEWYFDAAPLTDWPLYLVAATTGDIVLLDRNMADYTLNPGSAFWGRGDLFWYELDAKFYEFAKTTVPPKYRRLAGTEKCKRYENVAYYRRKRGDFEGSRKAALQALMSPAALDHVPSKLKTVAAAFAREAEWRLRGRKAKTE